MRTKILLLSIFIAINFSAFSQAPAIEWQKSLGGDSTDVANSIQQISDGGFIVAGYSVSHDGDVSGNHGGQDYWISKLDSVGNIIWQKSFGGSSYDVAYSVQQTTDGGFIVAGTSSSNDGDVSGNHGGGSYVADYWIVKLNSNGNLIWQKSLGGSSHDEAFFVQQTTDSGFIVAGESQSFDGDVTGNHGQYDYWIVKLNAQGNLVWQNALGGADGERAYSVQQINDGGYIIAGTSFSNDGDVSGNHGGYDYWIVKLDATGNLVWQKSLGGSGDDEAFSVLQTSDDGFIVAGYSGSNDGDVSGNHGGEDDWIVKLDTAGNIIWQKTLGGYGEEEAHSIQKIIGGGFIVGGWSYSDDADVSGNHGGWDYWIMNLDTVGNLVWQKSLGGSSDEKARAIQQTTDDGFIVAGESFSNDDDVSVNHGGKDYWIVKLTSDTTTAIICFPNRFISAYPNPGTGVFEIQNSSSPIQTTEAFNLLGEKVFSTSNFIPTSAGPTSNSIDLSSQPDGVYFLHLKTAEGIVVKKVVISK